MSAPPKNASGSVLRGAQTREINVAKTIATNPTDGKPSLLDVTARSSKMPRNSALLFPNRAPRSGADWAHYRGIFRMLDGRYYWASIWQRTCNGRVVLELRLELKEETTSGESIRKGGS